MINPCAREEKSDKTMVWIRAPVAGIQIHTGLQSTLIITEPGGFESKFLWNLMFFGGKIEFHKKTDKYLSKKYKFNLTIK